MCSLKSDMNTHNQRHERESHAGADELAAKMRACKVKVFSGWNHVRIILNRGRDELGKIGDPAILDVSRSAGVTARALLTKDVALEHLRASTGGEA